MKIKLDIDCTPEEARAFFGLPDMRPLQDDFVSTLRERMAKTMGSLDPESLVKQWLQGGATAFEQFQKAFWDQFGTGGKK